MNISRKTNIRSFRYSDEVAAVLEAQEGSSLNDKFEHLVLFCYYSVEKKKKEIATLDADIKRKHEQLRDLDQRVAQIHNLENSIRRAEYALKAVQEETNKIIECNTK